MQRAPKREPVNPTDLSEAAWGEIALLIQTPAWRGPITGRQPARSLMGLCCQ